MFLIFAAVIISNHILIHC